jgi:STAS domain
MADGNHLRVNVWAQGGALIVRPDGVLDMSSYAELRDCLLKCVAEQPRAVLVELGGLRVESVTLLSVFAAVWMRTASWPAVPLLLAATREPVRSMLRRSAVPRFVSTHDTLAQAWASIDRPRLRQRVEFTISSSPYCGRRVRRRVRDVCILWGLRSMCDDVMLVAGALVDNAVSDDELAVRLELREDRLTVAVRCADPRVRQPSRGPLDSGGSRGLAIVAAVCSVWGHAPTAGGGKVIWGVLRVPGYHRPIWEHGRVASTYDQ